jgi:hypothetical protein
MDICWQNRSGTRAVVMVEGKLAVIGDRDKTEDGADAQQRRVSGTGPIRAGLGLIEGEERERILAMAFESLVDMNRNKSGIINATRDAVSILLAMRGDKLTVGYDPTTDHMGVSAGGHAIDIDAIKKLFSLAT